MIMNTSIRKALITTLLSQSLCMAMQAMPAYPKPITVAQPDGTSITICLKGDERMNWAETTDGFSLLRNADGYWTFARKDKRGLLTASDIVFRGNSQPALAAGIKPGLRFAASQQRKAMKKAAPQTEFMVDGSFPTTGKRKLLVLLVNYSDTKPHYTRDDFYRMMNEQGYGGIGSFHDYYMQQSYGKLDIDVTVTDWITLPMPKGTYGPDGAPYMIYDALSIASQTIDMKQFDNDGDGILDGLAVIHQGTGQEMSGNSEDIWSHSATIYGQTFDGVAVRRYTIEPEMLALKGRMSTIGVICHEFGHALGAPDFYDTDYSESGGEYCGTGAWDLLGGGAWLGDYGDRPAGINGWQKSVFGWVDPVVLEHDTIVSDMPAADTQPVAFRMETGTPGEYFYMENRQQSGTFDASLPGHGLVVYHVNENLIRSGLYNNDINASFPQGIYTVCADAGVDPASSPSLFGDVNSAAAPFPGEYGHTDFSDRTSPSTHSLDGRYAYRALSDISENNGTLSFRFTHEDEPDKPEHLKASTADGEVALTWDMAAEAAGVDHFTIYRNGTKVGTSRSNSFTDREPDSGKLLTYQVDATYTDQLISHPSQVSIMVPANRVSDVEATADGDVVTLSWTTNDILSWTNTDVGKLSSCDINLDSVAYACRFSAENLSTYVGGKITRVGFLPMQGPSEIGIKLKVYAADADGGEPRLVSERNVKEFAKAQPRDLKLTQPVTIEAGKDYWVAVECGGKNGVVTVACDNTDVVGGYGNCIVSHGKFGVYDSAPGNFYINTTILPPDADYGHDIASGQEETADPSLDFYFPKGFAVMCDGSIAARTTRRSATFRDVAPGEHSYSVASLFRGDNVSKAISKNVTVTSTAIGSAHASSATAMVKTADGQVSISGFDGQVAVADVSGATVADAECHGNITLNLQPGVYVVRLHSGTQRQIMKVVVD